MQYNEIIAGLNRIKEKVSDPTDWQVLFEAEQIIIDYMHQDVQDIEDILSRDDIPDDFLP